MNCRSAGLFAGLGFMAACLACHSVGKPMNPADGAAGSGGGGAGATDGAAPDRSNSTDGAAPDRSSAIDGAAPDRSNATDGAAPDYPNATDGAAADRSSATDATDGAVAMTPAEVCQAAIKAQAERNALCRGSSIESLIRVASLCPDYYFNADSNRTVADVAACLGPLAARSCTDVALNFLPSCLASGNRLAGAGCSYGSQCQSGMCGSTGGPCPVCLAARIPIGSPCARGYCQDGSFCHPTTGICTDAATIVYATQGQPCDLHATPAIGCAGDLLCLSGSYVSTAGTCQPFPGVGQPCVLNSAGDSLMCAAGTTCTNLGVSGTNTCTLATCGAGPQCDDPSYCAPADGGFACMPHPTAGQPCDALSATCLSPEVCAGSPGKCAIPRALRETCDADNPCADLLSCVAGTCQPLATANCPAGGGDGGTG